MTTGMTRIIRSRIGITVQVISKNGSPPPVSVSCLPYTRPSESHNDVKENNCYDRNDDNHDKCAEHRQIILFISHFAGRLGVDRNGFPQPLNKSGTKANNDKRRQRFNISPNPFLNQYEMHKQ